MSAEVFISYASQDRERIIDLVKRLDDAGVSVFRPYQDPAPWMQETVNRAGRPNAEHFLVCLTHASKLGSAFGRRPRWSPTEGWEAQGRSPRSV